MGDFNLVLYANIVSMGGYAVVGFFSPHTIHKLCFKVEETTATRGFLHAVASVVSGVVAAQALAATCYHPTVKRHAIQTFAVVQALSIVNIVSIRELFDPLQFKILLGLMVGTTAVNAYYGWLVK